MGAERAVPFGTGEEIGAAYLDQGVALVADMIAIAVDELGDGTLEAVAPRVQLADAAAAPEEIEASTK